MIKLTHILQEGGSRNIGYAKFIFSLQTLISDLAPNAWEDKSQIDSTSMKRIHNSLKKRYGSDYKKYNALLKTQKGQFGWWYLKEGSEVHEGMMDRLGKFMYKASALVFPKMTAGKFFLMFRQHNLDIRDTLTKAYVDKTLPTEKVKREFYTLLKGLKEGPLVHEDFSKRDWDVKWKMPKDNLFNVTKTTDAVKNRYKALQFLLKGKPKELRAFDNNDNHPAYDMSYDELMKWYNGLK